MSLTLIAAVTAAVAASFGYLVSRRKEPEAQDEKPGRDQGSPEQGTSLVSRAQHAFKGLPLQLGDVVMSESEERWLAGAIVVRERGEVLSALFLAPEGVKQGAVAVFAPPRQDIYWMAPADVESPAEPPATLEIGGIAMRRRGRLPVTLERLGQGSPRVGGEGIFAAYEGGGGDVAVVIGSEGRTHAWVGRQLEQGEYERLGQGSDG